MKPPRFHRRDQACGGCSFPLHVTDPATILSAMSEGEQDAEFESADSGAQGEDVPGTNSHTTDAPDQPPPHRSGSTQTRKR